MNSLLKMTGSIIIALALQAPAEMTAAPALSESRNAAVQSSRQISGVVLDSNGEPVIGAAIFVVGDQSNGAITDLDGRFSMDVPAQGRLNVSCLGFETMIVSITDDVRYVIRMKEDSMMLDDVVVVGYGVQKKESVVGAISQVKGESLVDAGVSNITNAIAGKLSGVTTIQSSGQPGQNDAEIIIRGVSSFGSSAPLVLV